MSFDISPSVSIDGDQLRERRDMASAGLFFASGSGCTTSCEMNRISATSADCVGSGKRALARLFCDFPSQGLVLGNGAAGCGAGDR